ncbi:Uncharacterised protein [uncultured Clostridium sp.]|uniref:hypothetical protein n=1 Tax=uncultured Clostridium sp. TaxID=59620 RepID=UPI000821EBA8|nr:hypothetical protein [uncultured Clostridium sp.]SCK04327.1 Uncharacterised protein [uncultured Clostridium sp.]
MKITAEFNSTSEVLDFINALGAKAITSQVSVDGANVTEIVAKSISEDRQEDKKADVTDKDVKEKEETQKAQQANKVTEDKKSEVGKVTKEKVREVFSKLVKAGKQKEAKELTAKYGASKVGEVKEEDYAAILKDAEELL